ncbi:MAG: HAMP domain-containing sensor histidine kinase [Gallionella sp.]|nr:HAMP domain-containing sensor histidine kinase [Gallionella sp.]MDD4946713.1 HAMP domain-containing sensor histidine kinase [Gallionella sp.]
MERVLSALVIHDIKNALALLEIDLEQLNHHADIPPEGRHAYHRCIELKNRLVSFLTLYKHEQSGLQPVAVEVSLAEFVEDLVGNSSSAMMSESHHGHPITVRAATERMSPEGGFAQFDENLLELALESAINNAVRYAHHTVEVWFEQSGDKVVFRVADDGVGVGLVDERMQRKTADTSASTGLGLALCKAVADAHGSGAVSLENVQGGGTLFSMTLCNAS